MLLKLVETARMLEPVDLLAWLVSAAIIAFVVIAAVVFVAECFCERNVPGYTPNSPYFDCRNLRARIRRRRLA